MVVEVAFMEAVGEVSTAAVAVSTAAEVITAHEGEGATPVAVATVQPLALAITVALMAGLADTTQACMDVPRTAPMVWVETGLVQFRHRALTSARQHLAVSVVQALRHTHPAVPVIPQASGTRLQAHAAVLGRQWFTTQAMLGSSGVRLEAAAPPQAGHRQLTPILPA